MKARNWATVNSQQGLAMELSGQHLLGEHKAGSSSPSTNNKKTNVFRKPPFILCVDLIVSTLQTSLPARYVTDVLLVISLIMPCLQHFPKVNSAIPSSSQEPPCRETRDSHCDFDLGKKAADSAEFYLAVEKDACPTPSTLGVIGVLIPWDCPV